MPATPLRLARSLILLLSATSLVGLSACGGKPKDEHAKDAHGKDAHGSDHGAGDHWTYSGDAGPEHWGGTCSTGQRQSPIDLKGPARSMKTEVVLDYQSGPARIANKGHTIQIDLTKGGDLVLAGERYTLQQFHFHTPSEHALEGRRPAMEAHFVHKNAKGDLAVVGVMLEIGAADPMLAPIWTNLPPQPGAPTAIQGVLINARDLMPATEEFFVYSGSLTTPPCSEGVTWLVFNSPMSISPEQASAFERIVGPSARPLQPAKDRDLLKVSN